IDTIDTSSTLSLLLGIVIAVVIHGISRLIPLLPPDWTIPSKQLGSVEVSVTAHEGTASVGASLTYLRSIEGIVMHPLMGVECFLSNPLQQSGVLLHDNPSKERRCLRSPRFISLIP